MSKFSLTLCPILSTRFRNWSSVTFHFLKCENLKLISYSFRIIIISLFFTSCNPPGATMLIVTNETNHELFIDFQQTRNPVDTLVKIPSKGLFRHTIFEFDKHNHKTHENEVEVELSKIGIFKIINNDTIHLPSEIYNKVKNLSVSADYDFGNTRIDYYLNVTEEMFPVKRK